MDVVVWIVIGLLAAGTLVLLWNRIVQFLQSTLLPLVRRLLGDTVADFAVNIVSFLDKRVCPAREVLLSAWKTFKYHVLAIRTVYKKRDAHTASATTEAFVRTAEGKVVKQTKEEVVAWHDLPDDIRQQMMAKATTTATVDDMDVVEGRLRERMQEEGMELTLADAT